MVVVDPAGAISRIEVLSFSGARGVHARGRSGTRSSRASPRRRALDQARDPPVSGATLTARATTDAARRVLALHTSSIRRRRSAAATPSPRRAAPAQELPMKRWEAWWNHSASIAVSLTGLVYGIFKYFVPGSDPYSRVGIRSSPGSSESAHPRRALRAMGSASSFAATRSRASRTADPTAAAPARDARSHAARPERLRRPDARVAVGDAGVGWSPACFVQRIARGIRK